MRSFTKLLGVVGLSFALGLLAMTTLNPFVQHVSAEDRTTAELPHLRKSDPLPANIFIELAKAVNPAVVNINTTQLPHMPQGNPQMMPQDPLFDLFQQFMGPGQGFQQRPIQSLGTGFVIREDGLIVTNNHVVDQADIIKVQLNEQSKELLDAEVIGKDDKMDIALIKIKAKKKLTIARLGSSAELEVGEWVAAFGNPYGHGHTMTKGIVSALGREINEINVFPFIQTDASINPGNSGGPLVNIRGEVIGVNAAIDPRAQGIGFAIPIDNVKSILPALETDGRVKRGFIGVYMAEIDPESAQSLGLKQTEGALVTQVIEGSPAEEAGLKPYDLIVEFNGKPIASTSELSRSVATTPVGQTVALKVSRNNKMVSLKLKIGQQPDDKRVASKRNKKIPKGQPAPGGFGFSLSDYTPQLAETMNLPNLREARPVIVDVDRNSLASRAGLAPGDIILDVNRIPVRRPHDVFEKLRPGSTTVLRVLKGDRPILIYLR
jgi:serine protease Do